MSQITGLEQQDYTYIIEDGLGIANMFGLEMSEKCDHAR